VEDEESVKKNLGSAGHPRATEPLTVLEGPKFPATLTYQITETDATERGGGMPSSRGYNLPGKPAHRKREVAGTVKEKSRDSNMTAVRKKKVHWKGEKVCKILSAAEKRQRKFQKTYTCGGRGRGAEDHSGAGVLKERKCRQGGGSRSVKRDREEPGRKSNVYKKRKNDLMTKPKKARSMG